MTRRNLILLAAGGSAALLIGAWTFQYFGYPPCKLCIWQRWPHGVAVLIGLVAVIIPVAALALLGALAALTTASVGLYHTGVERAWWKGPDTCTSGDISGLSADELMNQILAAPLIRCDEVAWQFLTLSMASWNMVISFGLTVVWLKAWRAAR